MTPGKIRLIHLKTETVHWHDVNAISWNKVWAVSHVWDRKGKTTIPLSGASWESKGGVTWESTSFSSKDRFNIVFNKIRQIVGPHGAEYIWMDAACIDQDREDEKEEQIPFMRTIYSESAGCVAFGTLSPDDRFVEIASTYNDGRKAWVCDWFERVWTFQELQLPKVLLFVSGDQVLTRNEVYLSFLMMSPYLTSPHPSTPSCRNDPTLSIQDVLNSLSPRSRTNTQRSLMQTSKRGCSSEHIHDKVYGVLGVLAGPFSELRVDYDATLEEAMLNLMKLMSPRDVLDTLTFNTLPPADNIHDAFHWSGMVMFDEPTEHPSYEKDIHHPTDALVVVLGEEPCAYTVVCNAPLWKVVVKKPEDADAESSNAHTLDWLSMDVLSQYAKLRDDFSKVERSADYIEAIGRAKRSLRANWSLLQPLAELNASVCDGVVELLFRNPPPETERSDDIPPNRLGDESLFDQEVTILVCRSKANKPFHYGIVVTSNEHDTSWHKVCTAAFSDSCVVNKAHVERVVVIGK